MSTDTDAADAPTLRIHLFGGFRVERDGGAPLAERWPRPSARTLVKLLAVSPGHSLHREQAMEFCWPDADPQAALGSLRVALHAARRAIEPELAPRAASSYLTGDGSLLRLDPRTVRIDADEAEAGAEAALVHGGRAGLAAALDAFTGELLPEDRYAPWAEARRAHLAALRERTLLALAAAHLAAGAPEEAVPTAERVLAAAPAEEGAHRILIEAYLRQGLRRRAVRQYHLCREALDTELGVRPGPETEALHQEALAAPRPARRAARRTTRPTPPPALRLPPGPPLRGRDEVLARLLSEEAPPVLLVTGEAGLGKTRLVGEAARLAAGSGTAVLWGAGHDAEGHTPYGPFAEALDGWLADRPAAERARAGAEYPELAALLPSLGRVRPAAGRSPEEERDRLFRATAGLLGELAAERPVMLVLDDLHAADAGTFQLLSHLARRARERGSGWQVLATVRGEELPAADPRRQALEALRRQSLADWVELPRLSREACLAVAADALTEGAGLGGGAAPAGGVTLAGGVAFGDGAVPRAGGAGIADGTAPGGGAFTGGPAPADGPDPAGGATLADGAAFGDGAVPRAGGAGIADGPAPGGRAFTGGPDPADGPDPAGGAALADGAAGSVPRAVPEPVPRAVPLSVPERVWELSLGNPLFALELARALKDGTNPADSGAPEGVRQLVAERLGRLDPAARRVVDVVAVAGQDAALAEVLDVARRGGRPRLSTAGVTEAVEAAVAASVLEERQVVMAGRPVAGLAFRHPLVRLTCYDGLSAARRRLLHSAYAEAVLSRRPEAVDTLAAHLARADDPRATGYLRQAAERAAALYANDTADRYYAELTGRLDALAAESARARIDRSAVLRRMGRFEEAARLLGEALAELERRGDTDGRVLAAARLAELMPKTRGTDEGFRLLDATPPGPDTPAAVASAHHLARGVLCFVAGRYEESVTASRAAEEAAQAVPGPERRGLLARALAARATSLGLAGRFGEAGPAAEAALPHAEAYGDPQLLAAVLSVLRETARRAGRLREAIATGRRALNLAERSGDPTASVFERANLAELHLLVEEPAQARELAATAVRDAEADACWCRPYALVALARVRMRAGEPGAGALLDPAERSARAQGDHQAQYEVRSARAELAVREGRPEQALTLLAGQRETGTAHVQAWALLACGRPEKAADVAAAEVTRARGAGERLAETEARTAHAAALAALGRARAAEREFARAAELAAELPYPAGARRLEWARGGGAG
ncbi:AAA family ATPase [Streptomyces sp. NPDC101160]|uniref:AAA family ATPase n=1 Tax=Streptomyces sp. NPDC101160 TaxID=3366118 RepID=UPI0038055770